MNRESSSVLEFVDGEWTIDRPQLASYAHQA
jgi:hypothetical protein